MRFITTDLVHISNKNVYENIIAVLSQEKIRELNMRTIGRISLCAAEVITFVVG